MTPPIRSLQMVTVRWYNACAEYAMRLSAGLAARGHDVTLLGYPDSPPILEAKRRGIPVIEEIDLRPGRLDAPTMAWRLNRLIRNRDIRILNAHRAEDHLFAALGRAGESRVRLVRTRGDVRPPRRNGLNRLLYERRTDAHVLTAAFMRERFYDGFRIPTERFECIPPAIDLATFRAGAPGREAARRELGLPVDRPIVGLIGRWTAAKGIRVAIDAFGRVHAQRPAPLFVVSGEAYDVSREELKAEATRAGLGDALLLWPRATDVRNLIRALDLGVVASVASEAICRVAMEYLALGTPLVGTDLNSIPEMVPHAVAGWIVPPSDAEAMAAAILLLLDDEALRARLAAEAPRVADRRFDMERLLDQTERLYARLLEGEQ